MQLYNGVGWSCAKGGGILCEGFGEGKYLRGMEWGNEGEGLGRDGCGCRGKGCVRECTAAV